MRRLTTDVERWAAALTLFFVILAKLASLLFGGDIVGVVILLGILAYYINMDEKTRGRL